jgi:glycosyltransferase involved in cell wall biosynthesis
MITDMQEQNRKVLYITAQTPTGWAETFILSEMIVLKQLGVNLLIIPRNPSKNTFHKEADKIIKDSLLIPLINIKITIKTFYFFVENLFSAFSLVKEIISKSASLTMFLKNLAILPKTFYLKQVLLSNNITHIHAHWGGTTSTMAYILSKLTKIPWSLTLHRWGIKENNMLENKVRTAEFVRCISEHGKNELIDIIGDKYFSKIKVIHMGVSSDIDKQFITEGKKDFIIVVPANLIPVKGHKYLIKALAILANQNVTNIKCYFFGDGESREVLESRIESEHLNNMIEMSGKIAHNDLFALYATGNVSVVILPSINTKDGVHEGIPVSLMEAMAYGIPVISTNTGGIPELLESGGGIMVEEKNPQLLADEILRLMNDKSLRIELSENGKKKIEKDFNLKENAKRLVELFSRDK